MMLFLPMFFQDDFAYFNTIKEVSFCKKQLVKF